MSSPKKPSSTKEYNATGDKSSGMTVVLERFDLNGSIVFHAYPNCGPRPELIFNGVPSIGEYFTDVNPLDPVDEKKEAELNGAMVLQLAVKFTVSVCAECIHHDLRPEACKNPFTTETPVVFPTAFPEDMN